MTRIGFGIVALLMLAVGAAVRINNAAVFPPLQAFDGFPHFSYVWFMAEEWRVPLATTGWEFFQPPLYYWFMAAIWDAMAPVDPVWRLRTGTMIVAMLGLSLALVAGWIVRREMPSDRIAQLLAIGLMLFVPVHLYTAGFIGNENLTAVVCAWALLTLVATLRQPTVLRAGLLGFTLGLAMLTKFTGLVVVAGAFGTLGLRAIVRRSWKVDGRTAAIAAAIMLMMSGWFYARNIVHYGTPFKMSREEFFLQRYEGVQSRGQRGFLEYVLFDPMILRRPEWPRGVALAGGRMTEYSAMRESVPTGLYANTWFDGYGGWVLPKVTQSEAARRAGQVLLTLGLVPTALMAIGFCRAVRRIWREGWDDTLVAMLLTFGAMMVVVVQGTRAVPLHAAVKATYLMPASVVFAYWLALGAQWLGAWRRSWLHGAAVISAILAFVSCLVFFQGRLIGRAWMDDTSRSPVWRNVLGVVYYAGGDVDRARELFQLAAADSYHVGFENLAILALEEGRDLEALYLLRRAAWLQPMQSYGTPADQALFNQLTRAEYQNTMAILYHRLGWNDAAMKAAKQAVADDPTMPEAAYDLAVLKMLRAAEDAGGDTEIARRLVAQSRQLLFAALVLDPAFREAQAMVGVADAIDGECPRAIDAIERALDPTIATHRRYPVTGVGDPLASSVRRRRYITDLPAVVRPDRHLARCLDEQRRAGAVWDDAGA